MTGRTKHAERSRRSYKKGEYKLQTFNRHRTLAMKHGIGLLGLVGKLFNQTRNQRETKANTD